jgi:hypothetical protein
MSYRFKEPPARPTFGPLPEGDYGFTVASCDEPYEKNDKWILPVKLAIQPDGTPVFANPWSGVDKNGQERDGIAEFLISVNRAPKAGQEPDWAKIIGARGRCRLKVEIAQMGQLAGKEVNKVGWFHAPKQVGPAAEASRQSFTEQQIKESQVAIAKKIGAKDPDLDVEPDDIPF